MGGSSASIKYYAGHRPGVPVADEIERLKVGAVAAVTLLQFDLKRGARRGEPGGGGEDGAVVMTRTPDGVVGIINHSWTAAKYPAPPWVSISGTEGQIYFELGAPRLKFANLGGEQILRFENDNQGLVPMVREFRDSILEHREPITSGAAGIGALVVVLKAYESMEQGQAVAIG